MLYSRIVLGLIGAVYVFFGVWALARPADITAMTEIALTNPTAITDGRAVYGGLTLGLGLVFAGGAARLLDVRTCVAVLFLTLLFPVVGRLIGIALDAGGTESTFAMMRGEVLFLLLATIAMVLELRRTRATEPRQI